MKRGYTLELRSGTAESEITNDGLEAFAEALFADRRLAGPVATIDGALRALEIRTSVDATSAAAALDLAQAALVRAALKAGIDVDVAVASVWTDVDGIAEPDELVFGGEVARRLNLSRERIRQLVEGKSFPRPLATTNRDRIYRWGDVAEWAALNERKTKAPRRRKTA